MKAFLLAAGRGTRLRPLTDHLPKCLVPIEGRPLLEIWFRLLRHHGITHVLVNTHHLAEQVRDYVATHPVSGLDVTLFHEETLLGSAGTVAANRAFVEGEDSFFIIYADNLADVDLSAMRDFHSARQSPFTMGLFQTQVPTQCGIALCDDADRIVEFEEKPEKPKSNWANAGLYLARPSLFDLLPESGFSDFGFHVLPKLVGSMYGYPIKGFYEDTGTPERLERARREWASVPDRPFLKNSSC